MERRDFLANLGVASGAVLAGCSTEDGQKSGKNVLESASESQKAWTELSAAMEEISHEYLSAERGINRLQDIADGYRFLSHILQGGLLFEAESDPARPVFHRIVSPTRKMLGDNPDAIYYQAAISGDRNYRVRGNISGAVYCSITIESGTGDGSYSSGVAAAINDSQMKIAADGFFELILSAEPAEGNWLKLPKNAARITTRHYFEKPHYVAAQADKHIPLVIENLSPEGAAPPFDDARTAESIRHVIRYMRGLTLDQPPLFKADNLPAWISTTPNQFNKPAKPGKLAFAAVDNTYAMAPYALGKDQALLISGRLPPCRFANIVLWNRFLQSYDYSSRRISLNRRQMRLEADGRYRIIVAHQEPGAANWLDTEGRPSGIMYWRFLLADGEVETPRVEVKPFAAVAR